MKSSMCLRMHKYYYSNGWHIAYNENRKQDLMSIELIRRIWKLEDQQIESQSKRRCKVWLKNQRIRMFFLQKSNLWHTFWQRAIQTSCWLTGRYFDRGCWLNPWICLLSRWACRYCWFFLRSRYLVFFNAFHGSGIREISSWAVKNAAAVCRGCRFMGKLSIWALICAHMSQTIGVLIGALLAFFNASEKRKISEIAEGAKLQASGIRRIGKIAIWAFGNI